MRNKGFTLIELLVVILIIGILAAIAVPQYFKVVERGRFAELSTCFDALSGSQERYYLKFNTYATALSALDTTCNLKYFSAVAVGGAAAEWSVATSRNTSVIGYGNYSIMYTKSAGSAASYSGSPAAASTDLLP